MIMWILLLVFCFFERSLSEHEITALPSQNFDSLPFRHYAGFIPISSSEEMFYWYAESSGSRTTDPIVLWLNGGPGCSSLGGFFTENGPFVVRSDLSVELNPYRWNRNANIVWVESPVGVGFSGPPQPEDYYSDEVTTDRNYQFLQQFFIKYPELKNRDFFITGESYAGIYIPLLSSKLVQEPIEGVNFKGFAVGNPFTDNTVDGNAYFDYFYTHAMIPIENYDDLRRYCKDQLHECIYTAKQCSIECTSSIKDALLEADIDQMNPYYIYGDKCLLKNGQAGLLRYTTKKLEFPHRGEIGACTDQFTEQYLNLPEVQNVLNIGHRSIHWTDCNDRIGRVYQRTPSALPYYKDLLNHNLKILVYSGDADSVVNFIGTERWITSQNLNLNVTSKWSAWFGPDNQLAGYFQEYDGLTFRTVKGAGHMVPSIRPLHALYLFENFLYDNKRNFSYPIDAESLPAPESIVPRKKSPVRHLGRSFGSYRDHVVGALIGCGVFAAVFGVGYLVKTSRRRVDYEPLKQ